MKRDVALYLSDIIENMNDASRFLADIEYDDFIRDKKTVNAVVRSIEVIGEATKHVPQSVREMRPGVCIEAVRSDVFFTAVTARIPHWQHQANSHPIKGACRPKAIIRD